MVPPESLLQVTLNKILTCEYVNGSCCYDRPSKDDTKSNDNEIIEDGSIHPIDNLLALIHCSDDILRQTLMLKLSFCQVAVPLLIPNPLDNTVTFLLSAMRSLVKKWDCRSPKHNEEISKECFMINYPSPIVSFIQIGFVLTSKSGILNKVVETSHSFFNKNYHVYKNSNIKVKCKKKLAEGLVDLFCYLPCDSKKSLSVDPLLFLNLHGDALKCEKQVKFLQRVSTLSVVFMQATSINTNAIQLVQSYSESLKKVLLIVETLDTEFENKLGQLPSNVETLALTVGIEIESTIQEKIIEVVEKPNNNVKLSQCIEYARNCEILVDEDDECCMHGKQNADKILDEIKNFPRKEKLRIFPLQGDNGWSKWAEINREQHREFRKQTRDLEKYNARKNDEKRLICKKMLKFCKNLSSPMSYFLQALLELDNTIKLYFLNYLKLLLDDYNFEKRKFCQVTPEARHKSIGLEHFFREICHAYETAACLKQLKEVKNLNCLPRVMAELMVNGHYMELMDGNTSHVPINWVSAVFKELQELLVNSTLYAMSIVGVQSTGKSTLLNTMFGINFNVSIGRCTRGAFVQLLSFDESAKKILKCDHLLLIDTEGLRAPELAQLVREEHDNELATFVIGLADAAIITVRGEVQGELANILPTVTHALIRMDKIKINPSCKFVHQQMLGTGIKVNTSEGRKKFLSELDENIQRACELEHIKGKHKSFSKFMNFNKDTDVLYFDSLWDGTPPMAGVNIKYTESAQKLKTSLIECKSGCSRQSTFQDFSVKIDRLWNAVLREQFLFSFRNTLEVMYHKEFNQKHSEWKAVFQRNLLQWKDEVEFKFKNDTTQAVNGTKTILSNQIVQILDKTQSEVIVERDNYITSSKHKKILENWRLDSDNNIEKYREYYWTQAMEYVEQLASARTIEIKVQEIIDNIDSKLKVLASGLVRDNDKRLPNDDLKKIFDEQWNIWLGDIPSITFKSTGDVEVEILNILRENFFALHKVIK